ncbi:putative ABC-type phosphate transporter [Helianthus anomalus]
MMISNNLFVLEALDTADTQWFHCKVFMIAGMGVFTAAYDLFSIVTVSKLLGRLYYRDHANREPGRLPFNIGSALVGVALVGTLTGQLVFGWLGDKLGRKKVYGITLLLMTLCAICSGLSFGYSLRAVIGTLCFFRFWLGLGIGGAYTLSAIIMSEHANKRTRGSFISAVYAMQGVGVFFCGIVSMIVSHLFLKPNPAPSFQFDHLRSTQPNADYAWRIVFMLGAFPALLTYFLLIKMPETARYTAVIEGNTKQAGADMGLVSDIEIQAEEEKLAMFNSNNDYPLLSRKFFERHGLHLIGTMSKLLLLYMG